MQNSPEQPLGAIEPPIPSPTEPPPQVCPHCGTPVPAGQHLCPNCGAALARRTYSQGAGCLSIFAGVIVFLIAAGFGALGACLLLFGASGGSEGIGLLAFGLMALTVAAVLVYLGIKLVR
jgi:predicted nucleic acid-binding Zn ribbon protein